MNNTNIVFYIVLVLYNLLIWEDTRKKILSMTKLMNLVMRCLKIPNSRILFITINFIDLVQLYNPTYNEEFKKIKFKLLNKDLAKYLDEFENSIENDDIGYK